MERVVYLSQFFLCMKGNILQSYYTHTNHIRKKREKKDEKKNNKLDKSLEQQFTTSMDLHIAVNMMVKYRV